MKTKRALMSMLCLFAGGAAACNGGSIRDEATITRALEDGREIVNGYFPTPAASSFIIAPGNVATSVWRYTVTQPTGDWTAPSFNHSSWPTGEAGFHTTDAWPDAFPADHLGATWDTSDIWMRRTFTLTAAQLPSVVFWGRWDDWIEIYVNGRLAVSTAPGTTYPNWTDWYKYLGLNDFARAGLVAGTNTIAIHARNDGGPGFIDIGLAPNPMVNPPSTGFEATPALAALTETVRDYMRDNVIPAGAFAVIKDDKIVVQRGFGYMDKARTRNVPQDAIFRLASVDKMFTFGAARKQFEQGTFFVDPVTGQQVTLNTHVFPLLAAHGLTFLPGESFPDGINEVTIQHIIDHKSGIFQERDNATVYAETGTDENTYRIHDFMRYLYGSPLFAFPGTVEEYNNNAPSVLRYLERVLNGDFQTYMQKQLLGPAGSHDVIIARERMADRSPREPWYATLRTNNDFWIGLDEYYALSASAEGLARYIRRYDLQSNPTSTYVNPTTGLWTPANNPFQTRDWNGLMEGTFACVRYHVNEQIGIVVLFNLSGWHFPLIDNLSSMATALPASAWGISGPPVARNPVPNDASRNWPTTPTLSWTAGAGATSHDVRFGTTFPLPFRGNQTGTSYNPGALQPNTTYYWRIDEKNSTGTREGTMWSFTTSATLPAVATNPSIASGSTGVSLTPTLSWTAGSGAVSHDVYFGLVSEPPFAANRTVTNFTPGTALLPNTWYTWRIEERNASGAVVGPWWRFQTGSGPPASNLKVQYRVGDPGAPTDNNIRPFLKIANTGTSSVALSTLKVRYWFTRDTAQSLQSACDWAAINCANVTRAFVPVTGRPNADHYFEVGFTGSGTIAAGGNTGEILLRINKADWSMFNENNDHSYDGTKVNPADAPKITLYQGGTLVWGTEP
jgi:CubicO group peptidase (beta-lactamase class C family)